MLKRLQQELLKRRVQPGDRVGVAVSGGADSVALLRALDELRRELALVLTVLHFHHGIRGAEADRDEAFVAELAEQLGAECVIGRGDVPWHAKRSRQSLETAARELRYQFFGSVLGSGAVNTIATAHTMDDQAETVLMRTLRGAGTRGLSGIYPEKNEGRFLRPLLSFRRRELEEYLRALGQVWREDESNLERKHLRNQVRHDLLPMLVKDFNPNIVEVLARSAEVAQAEEAYWTHEMAKLLPLVLLPGKPTRGGGRRTTPDTQASAFSLETFQQHPVAVQRRLLVAALRAQCIEADSEHIERLMALARGEAKALELPGGWKASRSFRELRIEKAAGSKAGSGYLHPLSVPGEASLEEIKLWVQARLEPIASGGERYNSGQGSGELLLATGENTLAVRNWQAGDRFWPEHGKSEKKVKDILQQLKVPAQERSLWPVIAAGDDLIWVRGARQRPVRIQMQKQFFRLVIEAKELGAKDLVPGDPA
ncbi:MAG: tRNA lysidine(34) synthetase TilS [Terriglobales bacterium]